MTKEQLVVGKNYRVKFPEHRLGEKTIPAYEKELFFYCTVEGYDHECDCCGKDTMNAFIFCNEYHGDNNNTWDSGPYFVGGSSCLRKYVSELE